MTYAFFASETMKNQQNQTFFLSLNIIDEIKVWMVSLRIEHAPLQMEGHDNLFQEDDFYSTLNSFISLKNLNIVKFSGKKEKCDPRFFFTFCFTWIKMKTVYFSKFEFLVVLGGEWG